MPTSLMRPSPRLDDANGSAAELPSLNSRSKSTANLTSHPSTRSSGEERRVS